MSLIQSISGFFGGVPPTAAPGLGGAGVEKIGLPASKGAPGVGAPPAASFDSLLDQFVGDVDANLHAAKANQARVLSGETTNLHQAMISMQEASVAFSLMVEVRNKLVEGYQEVLRMQV